MKVECKGGCGESRSYGDMGRRSGSGYGMYRGDALVEWVCEECWRKGVRTTAHEKARVEEKEQRVAQSG